jgi:two-component system sensor histidine kinase RegB
VFTSVYAFIVADESRQLADALNATEMVLAHEQHLSALDGLAAAAAHELGTPLATITLVSKELLRALEESDAHYEDIGLLQSQAQRCREILAKLTSLSTDDEGYLGHMPLTQLINEIADPHRPFDINLHIQMTGRDDSAEPIGYRNPAILYGLGNLVENAVDFANGNVWIAASWDKTNVEIKITDDGPGIDPGLVDRIGDPYVTTRKTGKQGTGELGSGELGSGGLGLGFFIAKTLLGRSGASVAIENNTIEKGAIVTVIWPRERMTQSPETTEQL